MTKITIGFKCDPQMKNDLLAEAEEAGITLSGYIENICANRCQSPDDDEIDNIDMDDLEEQVEGLSASLKEYEDLLGPLFTRHQGQTLDMQMPDGRMVPKKVNHPVDVLEIILNAVKKP